MASILDNLPGIGAVAAGSAAQLPAIDLGGWGPVADNDDDPWGFGPTQPDGYGGSDGWTAASNDATGGADWGVEVEATPSAASEALLEGLNDPQRAAVVHQGGPLLIIAGAGSGKTRVLTHRIAYLIATKRAWPSQILAITFTNKAAAEMRERVVGLIGDEGSRMWVSTFHSACLRILRREHEGVGLRSSFSIYDSADSLRLVTMIAKERNIDPKKHPARGLIRKISDLKNELITPEQYIENGLSDPADFDGVAAEVYQAYQQRLQTANAVDFDDIIMLTVRLLQRNPAVAEHYRRRFRHILVDEYQDTNHAQYTLIHELTGGPGTAGWDGAPPPAELTVVGDADQSIYAFRGATIRNINQFTEDYPDATTILLEQNYRSTQNILDAANAVISKNLDRQPKNLWTAAGSGSKIVAYAADDEYGEARYIAKEIDRLGDDYNIKPSQIAIFYRANAQSRALEEVLIRVGIPYKIVGGTRFYERREVKDAVAYLHAIANIDDDVNLRRVFNVPKRGLGDRAEATVAGFAGVNHISFGAALARAGEIPGLAPRTLNPLVKFAKELATWREQLAKGASPADLLNTVLDETGYLAELQASTDPQDATRVENLAELVSVATEFAEKQPGATLADFLERIALVADADQVPNPEAVASGGASGLSKGVVTLMTLHTAKGLEFPVVFLTGLEDGTFPHMRSMYSAAELAEERRLAYVGLTRARQRLYLTRSAARSAWGNTTEMPESRFLSDVPADLIHWERRESATASIRSGSNPSWSSASWRQAPAKSAATASKASSSSSSSLYGSGGHWGGQRAKAATTATASQRPADVEPPLLAPGDRVNHDEYGLGKVVAIDGVGRNAIARVDFGSEGLKRLLLRYAPLQKL